MWVLGNENNLPSNYLGVNATRTNAASHPEVYARFINEVAEMIHRIDGNHPVAVGNLELGMIDYYKKYAPALDILGVNSYRGMDGFGALFLDVKKGLDKPVLLMEYGCDAYTEGKGPDEDRQYKYLKGNLRDIIYNKAGGPGVGNALGGFIFEYLDEWWKAPHDPDDQHSTVHQQMGQTPDGYIHEEWFGIAGQGSGKHSPFERHLRKSYYYFKDVLNKIPGS
jgi:beta-glucuronidase